MRFKSHHNSLLNLRRLTIH